MESSDAIRALSALAHDGRLGLVRSLVRAGPDGIAAGALARGAGLAPSTASAQLLVLANAGLVRSARAGRQVRYCAEYGQLGALVEFLIRDCCRDASEQEGKTCC